jgi:uncharacterized membrane protein
MRLILFRSVAILALGTCAAILADELGPQAIYCGFRGGCEEALSSPYGHPFGIPLSLIGVLAFACVLVLALLRDRRAGVCLLVAALLAGVTGAALIAVQLVSLRRTCALCLIVDGCAIALAALAVAPYRSAAGAALSPSRKIAWLCAGAVVVSAPLVWAWLSPERPVPEQVRAHWIAGMVTIVEVTDFDCPHCRVADAVLSKVVQEFPERVHFVRLAAAMPAHADSRPAARAYLAAMAQGKAEELAAELLRNPSCNGDDCRRTAESLGLDLRRYDADIADPATDAAIDATVSWAQSAGPGLPLIWIQDRYFYGVPAAADLRGALRRAERRLARR